MPPDATGAGEPTPDDKETIPHRFKHVNHYFVLFNMSCLFDNLSVFSEKSPLSASTA